MKKREVDERGRLRDPAYPAFLALIYQMLRPVAIECGYALALHGTMARDLDLIAVAWVDEALPPEALVERLSAKINDWVGDTDVRPKPHGRLSFSLHLLGTGSYVDLSVIPPRAGSC